MYRTCAIFAFLLTAAPTFGQDLLNRVKQLEDATAKTQADVLAIRTDIAAIKNQLAQMSVKKTDPTKCICTAGGAECPCSYGTTNCGCLGASSGAYQWYTEDGHDGYFLFRGQKQIGYLTVRGTYHALADGRWRIGRSPCAVPATRDYTGYSTSGGCAGGSCSGGSGIGRFRR